MKRVVLLWCLSALLWPCLAGAVPKVAVGIRAETVETDVGVFRVQIVITPPPSREQREAVSDWLSVRLSTLTDCAALTALLKTQVIGHVQTLWQTTVTAAEIVVFGGCQ